MPLSNSSFIDGFISETGEHLEAVNDGIIKLKNSPKNKEILSALMRHLHTMKGTSRMMNFSAIEKLSHGLEEVFKGIQEDKYDLTDHIVKLTFETSDCIKRALKQIKASGNDEIDVSSFLKAFDNASQGLFFSIEKLEAENNSAQAVNDEEENPDYDIENLENIKSIRIDIERINEVIRLFDNVIIRQFRFKHQLEEYEKKENDLPRQLKEEMTLIENSIFEAQHSILNLRMLPLDMILVPLKKEIEADAIALKKDIIIDIPHTDLMLDKAILELLKEILLHLVRNAMDHGIESPEERKAQSKNEKGTISIKTQQIADRIVISVIDDGRGIEYDKVREKACSMFPIQNIEISAMTEKELQQYIFMSGFTTTETSTVLSGRGLGLDIVRSDMEKIKGKIHLDSEKGKGTTFNLTIPVSLATQQGLFILCGNRKFMIPSHYIQEIIDITPDDFTVMQSQTFISLNAQLIPVYFLSSIIDSENKNEDISSVIILEYLETHVAIVVDKVLRYENVVVNAMPQILKKLKPVQGVVYDENYSIIPILNIPDIMQRIKNLYSYDLKKYKTKNEKVIRTILVVDDSMTTRQIEQTIFETDGYLVECANDGIDALEVLKKKHVDAIVSDIKMPRMDGMVLLNNVRRMEEYAETPFIVVSGVYDIQLKNDFISNGAQAFIVKSDFQRGNLLQITKELLND